MSTLEENAVVPPMSGGPNVPEQLFAFKTVAGLLDLSYGSVANLVAAGKLKAITIGSRTRRIPASALREFIRANAVQ